MKDFKELVLCDEKSERVDVHVWADLVNGSLTIAGNDIGSAVEDFFGDIDFEYWYFFDQESTTALLSAIHGEADPKAVLLREFGGTGGIQALREFCEQNGIQYRYCSYV